MLIRSLILAAVLIPALSYGAEPQQGSPELRATVRAYTHDIVKCYGRAAQKAPDTHGQVAVELQVSAGHANDIVVVNNTTGRRKLGACVARRMSHWRYQTVEDGPYNWQFSFEVRRR